MSFRIHPQVIVNTAPHFLLDEYISGVLACRAMKNSTTGTGTVERVTAVLFVLLCSALVFALPIRASAAEVAVQTAQLLPPGENTCAALPIQGFTPYIYDGALHAFEFSIADSSYVAVAGSAGKIDIPFNQMTRRIETSGNLRIHADVPTIPIKAGITIRVTMLSANQATQIVCLSIVAAMFNVEGILMDQPAPAWTPEPLPPTHKPQPAVPSPIPQPPPNLPSATVSTSSVTESPVGQPVATAQNILKDVCAANGASRLWFVLLAIYIVLVAAAVFGQPQLPLRLRSQEWIAAAIVVPFLLLFGLWYFAESCRVSAWVPTIATLIALVGLATAFWDRGEKSPNIINLPGAKT